MPSRLTIISVVVTFASFSGVALLVARYRKFCQQERKSKKTYCITDKQVLIVNTSEEWEAAYSKLIEDLASLKVLGLDCEWVNKQRVALLQLATAQGLCVLVRMFKLWPNCPETLRNLLKDKSVLKVGVAVGDDGKKLHQDYGLGVAGCVDLRHLLKRTKGVYSFFSFGLQGLASGILDVSINKDFNIRCGNWEAEEYSKSQIDYAATDAAVAVDILLQLIATNHQMSTVPLSNGQSYSSHQGPQEMAKSFSIADYLRLSENDVDTFKKTLKSMCQGIVDHSYTFTKEKGENLETRKGGKKKDVINSYGTRQRPLWDNCLLEAPDGDVLCTCDLRKAQWYIDKELGDKICDDPVTIRLRFEPANRPLSERNYYLQVKENRCVVCGCDENYIRKFVIPFEYRKFFPAALKDHSSHDILLLCTSCHRRSCDSDSSLRQQLAYECNAPLESGPSAKTVLDKDLQKVRSAGRALRLNRDSIPQNRVTELEQILYEYYGCDTLTEDLLEQASEVDARQTADGYVPHGKLVVRHMCKNGGLLAFQARWRKHFLDSMQPQFMPAFWSVDYTPEGWIQAQKV